MVKEKNKSAYVIISISCCLTGEGWYTILNKSSFGALSAAGRDVAGGRKNGSRILAGAALRRPRRVRFRFVFRP